MSHDSNSPRRIPLVIDHDIGTNPDDYFAFDFVLKAERADLLFVVSGNREPTARARFARRVLDLYGRQDVLSYAGETTGCVDFFCGEHLTGSESYETDYVGAVRRALEHRGSITYLAIQGLSNVARILREVPEANERLHIVHMGLSTQPAEGWTDGGTNMKADQHAAKFVYEHAAHLQAVGLQTTLNDSLRVNPGAPGPPSTALPGTGTLRRCRVGVRKTLAPALKCFGTSQVRYLKDRMLVFHQSAIRPALNQHPRAGFSL